MFTTKPTTFKSGSYKLSAELCIPQSESKLPGVVIFHGRGSSKVKLRPHAQLLAKNGFLTLNFDFRGCGTSPGDFDQLTHADGLEDTIAAIDFLKKQPQLDKKRIGVFGGSYGAYLAAIVSGRRKLKSLVLAVPSNYHNSWWTLPYCDIPESDKKIFRKQGSLKQTKSIKAIAKYHGALLIIRHQNDDMVPERVVNAYYNYSNHAIPKDIKLVLDAPHSISHTQFQPTQTQLVLEWFHYTL